MKKILLAIIFTLVLTSCGTVNLGGKVKNVEIGMTKHELTSKLGKSYNVKGAVKTPDGTLETISYYDALYGFTYIFNLLDGKLVEWYEERPMPAPEVVVKHNHN